MLNPYITELKLSRKGVVNIFKLETFVPVVYHTKQINRDVLYSLVRKTCLSRQFKNLDSSCIKNMGDTSFILSNRKFNENTYFILNYDLAYIDLYNTDQAEEFEEFVYDMCTRTLKHIPRYKIDGNKRTLDGQMFPKGEINEAQKRLINSVLQG